MRPPRWQSLQLFIFLSSAFFLSSSDINLASARSLDTEVCAIVQRLQAELGSARAQDTLVMDMEPAFGLATTFGQRLSDQISSCLALSDKLSSVVDRTRISSALTALGIKAKDQWDKKNVTTISKFLGASNVIIGSYGAADSTIGLTLTAYRVGQMDDPQTQRSQESTVTGKISLSADVLSDLGEPLAAIRPSDGIYRAGYGGVSVPSCLVCPQPSLRAPNVDVAGLVKAYPNGGAINLKFVVTPEGTAKDFEVIRGVGYGYDEEYIKAIRSWKFKPAVDAEGKPVSALFPFFVAFKFR